jgi:hypothetical protein
MKKLDKEEKIYIRIAAYGVSDSCTLFERSRSYEENKKNILIEIA